MRTNIDIDDTLLQQAMELTHLETKKAVINYALKELVASKKRASILELKGKAFWDGDLDTMRSV